MSNKQGYEIPWWAIVLGFMLWPPIGFVLLFLNINGVRIPAPSREGSGAPSGGTSASRRTTPPAASKAKGKKGSKLSDWAKRIRQGRVMSAVGGFLSFMGVVGLADELPFALKYGLLEYASEWVFPLGILCAGLFMIYSGLSRVKLTKRQRLYMGVIGQRKSIFLSDLAGAAGVSKKKAIADIQDMLAGGLLPMGYIDRATDRLVLTEEGYQPPEEKAPPKAEEPKAQETDDDAILREIKAVNDAIPGEEMSRKIDRIGDITKRILDYQRQNPAKADQLRQFLNYYLPTTLRLLRTYAQLDAQGVEGENITASKKRIEGMMDKVVEGFEKQLDQLFQGDAMDIATDVEVLERMLAKDGLSSGQGMTLGL